MEGEIETLQQNLALTRTPEMSPCSSRRSTGGGNASRIFGADLIRAWTGAHRRPSGHSQGIFGGSPHRLGSAARIAAS